MKLQEHIHFQTQGSDTVNIQKQQMLIYFTYGRLICLLRQTVIIWYTLPVRINQTGLQNLKIVLSYLITQQNRCVRRGCPYFQSHSCFNRRLFIRT